jgi:hypothetical protein
MISRRVISEIIKAAQTDVFYRFENNEWVRCEHSDGYHIEFTSRETRFYCHNKLTGTRYLNDKGRATHFTRWKDDKVEWINFEGQHAHTNNLFIHNLKRLFKIS